MCKKLTTEEWIIKAMEIHRNKYDYSKTVYINARNKVTIICQKHGSFEQKANDHLNGSGCKECAKIERKQKSALGKDQFIKNAITKHGNKYQYIKVHYVNNKTPVTITCPAHGDWEQRPDSHLNGFGCPTCGGTEKLSTEKFISRVKLIHNDTYDYSKVNYVNVQTKVTIRCQEHGEFEQLAGTHLQGCGCPNCGFKEISNNRIKSIETYLSEVVKKHGGKYNYSAVDYTGADNNIIIVCPEHGEFQQSANSHLRGRGCPNCAASGFKTAVPGILYYLKVQTSTGILYKIGITNKSVKERFGPDMQYITVLHQIHYKSGQDAYNEEQRILKEFKEFKYIGPDILKSGNTELFMKDILN